MAEDMKITFEMELKRVEEHMPSRLLRMMWEHAMFLLNQLEVRIDAFELASRDTTSTPHMNNQQASQPIKP